VRLRFDSWLKQNITFDRLYLDQLLKCDQAQISLTNGVETQWSSGEDYLVLARSQTVAERYLQQTPCLSP